MITKEQFLVEHNKLSPPNLQATLALLTNFKEQKKPLLKDDEWSIDKLRIPFITWLLAMSSSKDSSDTKELIKKGKIKEQIFHIYPREEA